MCEIAITTIMPPFEYVIARTHHRKTGGIFIIMEKEIWKDAVGFEGVYMVSNFGRVISLNYRHTGAPNFITPVRHPSGYLTIKRTAKGNTIAIHRLVAEAFIPNPSKLKYINHINEDKADNRACNLEWCTCRYNNTYGTRLAKMIATRKGRNMKTHFGEIAQMSTSGELIAIYPSTVIASIATGIDRSCINKCALGRQKSAGGYKWSYEFKNHGHKESILLYKQGSDCPK